MYLYTYTTYNKYERVYTYRNYLRKISKYLSYFHNYLSK